MYNQFEDIDVLKAGVVHSLYTDTADQNYIIARWSFLNGLHGDFLWLSVHALEKYMKAILLMNGQSARGYSHRVADLLPRVRCLVGPLRRINLCGQGMYQTTLAGLVGVGLTRRSRMHLGDSIDKATHIVAMDCVPVSFTAMTFVRSTQQYLRFVD